MGRVAALLAAALCGIAIAACGDGAEPGAPNGATLVLDFQPNAVHSGIYAAQQRGYFAEAGLDLEIREPSGSADSARLLEAGRADFAVMDINDFGIARQRGLGITAIAAVVQRPLASVIAADRDAVRTPADLEGATVGVTGVPSDDAVLDTVLAGGGLAPDAVERQTIGFRAVPLLAAGRVAAATAFWNAEGVQLREQGVPIREFRVDESGAPRYPELVIATAEPPRSPDAAACRLLSGLREGYRLLEEDPDESLDALLDAVPALDRAGQEAQMAALVKARAFSPELGGTAAGGAGDDLYRQTYEPWSRWAVQHGILDDRRAALTGFKSAAQAGACDRARASG